MFTVGARRRKTRRGRKRRRNGDNGGGTKANEARQLIREER